MERDCIWVNAEVEQAYTVVVCMYNAIIQEAFMVMLLLSGSNRTCLQDEAGLGSENTDKL